ncbi:hypothetical protein [Saccharothrix xinjiangensis]|uniref:Uncharacterized protein n=1 Tax=Saccharothrix xinjiangensis TaxID=204798 RepID=A0ABV9Y1Y6_9PSEU
MREWLEDLPHAVLRGEAERLDDAVFVEGRLVWSTAAPDRAALDRVRELNPHGLLIGLEDPRAEREVVDSPFSARTWQALAAVTRRDGDRRATTARRWAVGATSPWRTTRQGAARWR